MAPNDDYKKLRPCHATVRVIELTTDIKEHILNNKIYHVPLSLPKTKQTKKSISKIVMAVGISILVKISPRQGACVATHTQSRNITSIVVILLPNQKAVQFYWIT